LGVLEEEELEEDSVKMYEAKIMEDKSI